MKFYLFSLDLYRMKNAVNCSDMVILLMNKRYMKCGWVVSISLTFDILESFSSMYFYFYLFYFYFFHLFLLVGG